MAIGDTLASWTALAATSPSSNAATLDQRNSRVVLDFDASTAETTYFAGVLPSHYAGGDLSVAIHWMATSATSGSVRWSVQFERLAANGLDLDASDFQSASAVTSAANATSGKLAVAVATLTALDSATAGDAFRIALARDVTHTDDDVAGDAEVLAVKVLEA
jgi:hypothetical protein